MDVLVDAPSSREGSASIGLQDAAGLAAAGCALAAAEKVKGLWTDFGCRLLLPGISAGTVSAFIGDVAVFEDTYSQYEESYASARRQCEFLNCLASARLVGTAEFAAHVCGLLTADPASCEKMDFSLVCTLYATKAGRPAPIVPVPVPGFAGAMPARRGNYLSRPRLTLGQSANVGLTIALASRVVVRVAEGADSMGSAITAVFSELSAAQHMESCVESVVEFVQRPEAQKLWSVLFSHPQLGGLVLSKLLLPPTVFANGRGNVWLDTGASSACLRNVVVALTVLSSVSAAATSLQSQDRLMEYTQVVLSFLRGPCEACVPADDEAFVLEGKGRLRLLPGCLCCGHAAVCLRDVEQEPASSASGSHLVQAGLSNTAVRLVKQVRAHRVDLSCAVFGYWEVAAVAAVAASVGLGTDGFSFC
jgi:uncharacterized membrane protein YkgB